MAAKAQLKADRSGSGSGALTAAAEAVPVVKMNPGVPGAATSPDVSGSPTAPSGAAPTAPVDAARIAKPASVAPSVVTGLAGVGSPVKKKQRVSGSAAAVVALDLSVDETLGIKVKTQANVSGRLIQVSERKAVGVGEKVKSKQSFMLAGNTGFLQVTLWGPPVDRFARALDQMLAGEDDLYASVVVHKVELIPCGSVVKAHGNVHTSLEFGPKGPVAVAPCDTTMLQDLSILGTQPTATTIHLLGLVREVGELRSSNNSSMVLRDVTIATDRGLQGWFAIVTACGCQAEDPSWVVGTRVALFYVDVQVSGRLMLWEDGYVLAIGHVEPNVLPVLIDQVGSEALRKKV